MQDSGDFSIKKILFIFGTRPEAIKMAPVIKEVQKSDFLTCEVCVTAQHRQMLDQVLELFGIMPDYDLNIMKPGQDLFDITGNILASIKEALVASNPDLVLVHGDTTTTFTASLASFYLRIPVGHVEAGLRTYNLLSPYPEEANRQLTARLTKLNFAPTQRAYDNLLKENIDKKTLFITGNSVTDALLMIHKNIESSPQRQQEMRENIAQNGYRIPRDKRIVLITGHRRENFGDGFIHICRALRQLANDNSDIDIVYPLHLNPNVQGVVHEYLDHISNVHIIRPIDYEPFVYLMSRSYIILTDSGGIQEEAPSLGKPVLVMRDTTERPEAVEAGTVRLVGTNKERIVSSTQKLLDDASAYHAMARAINPYGDGTTAKQIVNILRKIL